MSGFTFLEFKKNPQPSDKPVKLIGWAQVDIAGKMKVWFAVLSKEGSAFCKISSTRVGEEYVPTFSLADQEKEKAMMRGVNECVKENLPK